MKRPAAKPAAKSPAKSVKKPVKALAAAWLKWVPTEEKLRFLPGKARWHPDHPGVQHAGDIGQSCSASGADDYVNLDADLEFGTFEMPKVVKGGRKTTKKSLRRRGFVSGNPGKEIHLQCAYVKAMSVDAALKRLREFTAVTPDNLDQRCRYPEENPLEPILDGIDDECSAYQAAGTEIKRGLLDYIESKGMDVGKKKARSHFQAIVVEACNEKRNGHIWGEENPKAAMDQLKKKLTAAKNEDRRKIAAQIEHLKKQWGFSSRDPDDPDDSDHGDDRAHNDSKLRRHDAMIIHIARCNAKTACARVFLAYAASCFPNVGPRAREDFGLALAEGADAEAGEKIAAATTAALQKLQTQELFTALGASSLLLESSEAEATVTLRALQLQLLRKSSDSMLQALQEAASSADQASTMLFEISELKKALQKRRAEGQGRKAQKLLEETEAAVARLKECHRQKTCLLRARKARLCRAEDVTSLSAGVLVFRGRHRLGIQRCQGGPLTAASPCWLKFEAATPGALPGVSDDYEEHGQAWRRRFEEALCHLWIRKVDQQLAESRSALLPFSEVPSLLHRLQVGLLQATATCRERRVQYGDCSETDVFECEGVQLRLQKWAGDFLQAVAAQRPRILELPAPEERAETR
ncbi:unnamed protein product [Durusdinium trenchii]|uniref:Uncharacterized protein n=1 Tax=Durusdinium trenchii TaxID=1381693 RepID=A0ABP0IAC8_9DINO